jgi:hypothetical protein
MIRCPIHHNNGRLCLAGFSKLEIDRNNHKILSFDSEALKESIKCEFILIKILLIRLRRSKLDGDWLLFKFLIEKNLHIILNYPRPKNRVGLSPRWLASILETYIDHGNDMESANALIVTSFHKNERFFATICDSFNLEPKDYYNNHKKDFCGIDINGNQDIAENFFLRTHRQLSKTPVILSIFKKILLEILKKSDSSYSILCKISNAKIMERPIKNIFFKNSIDCS